GVPFLQNAKRRCGQPCRLPDQLGPQLVHAQRGGHHAAAGIRQAEGLQKPLHFAILATAPVEHDEGPVILAIYQGRQTLLPGIVRNRVHPLGNQGRQYRGTAFQGHFPLGGIPSQQHCHLSKSVFHGLTYHLSHGPDFRDTHVSSTGSPQAGRQPRQCPRRPAATGYLRPAVPAPEFPLHSVPAPKTGVPTCPATECCDTTPVRPHRESAFHPPDKRPSTPARPPPTTPVQSPRTDHWSGYNDGAGT